MAENRKGASGVSIAAPLALAALCLGMAGAEHDDHDHAGPAESGALLHLTERQEHELGIQLAAAAPGRLRLETQLLGDVVVNPDRLAHVVPLLPGVVREVRRTLGDTVELGEVMAVIDSRELAEAKAAFLAARQRRELAAAKLEREEELWQKKITSEEDYLDSRQALAEVDIELRLADQALHALGLSEEALNNLCERPHDVLLTRYTITAPLGGTIIQRHITLGERVDEETDVFTIADLRTVWVELHVPQKHLPQVREGQPVRICAGLEIPDVQASIDYISPIVGEQSRTAVARVEIPNPDGRWRPGLFVTAHLTVGELEALVVVPKTAVQTLDDESVVFVKNADGYDPRPIVTGRNDRTHVEVVAGLSPGERYVTSGAFDLKAQIITSGLDPHAGHGH